jgi:hypothetical protein
MTSARAATRKRLLDAYAKDVQIKETLRDHLLHSFLNRTTERFWLLGCRLAPQEEREWMSVVATELLLREPILSMTMDQ